jgi:hypothetical protein
MMRATNWFIPYLSSAPLASAALSWPFFLPSSLLLRTSLQKQDIVLPELPKIDSFTC